MPLGVKVKYYRGVLLQTALVAVAALLPALHANVINYRHMIPTRARNYSLKTLYHPKTDRKEEEMKEELMRG
jgi:hypothetical protein